MSKEQRLFNLATTTSNAFGIKSELAGYECTKFQSDNGGHFNKTPDEYAHNILVFADSITTIKVEQLHPELSDDDLREAKKLIDSLKGYDEGALHQIALDDWREQEEKANAD